MRVRYWSSDVCSSDLIADDEALEPHLALERVGQQSLVAVGLDSVPARETGHNGQRAGVDRGRIALRMLGDQFILADLRVALILALEGAAVGEIMFGGRRDMRGPDRQIGRAHG